MPEKGSLIPGWRLGALQARVSIALAGCAIMLAILIAAGIYIGANPLLHCRQHSTMLFFGTAIRTSGHTGHVSGNEWKGFVESAIVPRLPDGFTILEGQGGYRSAATGLAVHENTYVLMVAHHDEAQVSARLNDIIEDYKARFRQESVLRLDQCGAYRF